MVILSFLVFWDVQLSFATDATASNGAFTLAGTANSGKGKRSFFGATGVHLSCYTVCFFFLLLILLRRGFYRIPQDICFSARSRKWAFFFPQRTR